MQRTPPGNHLCMSRQQGWPCTFLLELFPFSSTCAHGNLTDHMQRRKCAPCLGDEIAGFTVYIPFHYVRAPSRREFIFYPAQTPLRGSVRGPTTRVATLVPEHFRIFVTLIVGTIDVMLWRGFARHQRLVSLRQDLSSSVNPDGSATREGIQCLPVCLCTL